MSDTPTTPPSATEERARSRKISALGALLPFLRPYRLLMVGALAALVATAMISLALPLAVRRVVDTFNVGEEALLDQYFLAALGIAGLLAVGSALRYALVTRLGERVVADIR
ncbi:MAG: ABC transporter, partial [Sulfitobacter sp.]